MTQAQLDKAKNNVDELIKKYVSSNGTEITKKKHKNFMIIKYDKKQCLPNQYFKVGYLRSMVIDMEQEKIVCVGPNKSIPVDEIFSYSSPDETSHKINYEEFVDGVMINVFWDTTGHETNGKSFCYPCDSVTVLAEENSRQQSKRGFDGNIWGTVTNDKVELLFKDKWKKFFDPRDHCSACLFMKNNKAVKNLTNQKISELNNIKIDNDLEHINFP